MAYVEFYIQNYRMNGSVVTDETLFQTVPMSSGMPAITNPKVKCEIGKAGSFEFGLELNSPYYDSMIQMKTLLRVVFFGNTIFRGRVLTIDRSMSRSRSIHCEGDLAFFLDTLQPGSKEDSRPTITVIEYMSQLIEQHNSCVYDPLKEFYLGEVPGQYLAASPGQRVLIPEIKERQQFGGTGWETTMDRLEGLISEFGGYFRTRYDPESKRTYLDWFDNYYSADVNPQAIEICRNLIDISGSTEVDNLFTVIIPVGKNGSDEIYITDYWPVVYPGHAKVNYIMVPEIASISFFSDEELNAQYRRKEHYVNAISDHGRIWKTVSFDNADTPEKLFKYAMSWIKDSYTPELTQWDVNALDMRIVDGESRILLVGDRVSLSHPEVDQSYEAYTIISAEYDLFNPDKNRYTIGIPNQEVNSSYGVKSKTDKSGSSGKGKGSGGISKPPPKKDPEEDVEENLEEISNRLEQMFIRKDTWGSDIPMDNALAFLTYNRDGTQKELTDEDKKESTDVIKALNRTRLDPTKQAALEAEAAKRGVPITDQQLLIDFTPEVKAKQAGWKIQTENWYVNQVGLTLQEAAVLLNDNSSQSWLANLVDDNGNWTSSAFGDNATRWTGSSGEALRQQAINARKSLSGKSVTPMAGFLNGMTENTNSLSAYFGGFFNLDGFTEQLDIGKIFNVDNLEETFSLESLTTLLDGAKGFLGLGDDPSSEDKQWKIDLNGSGLPISYTTGGKTYTIPDGAIKAQDFHLREVPSFKTEMAAIGVLMADYAKIGTLTALKADITELESKALTANKLKSTHAEVASLYATGGISCKGLIATEGNISASGTLSVSDHNMNIYDVGKTNGGKTLTFYRLNGGNITFSVE